MRQTRRMFAGWADFFELLGTASATLIGLLFLVVSLARGLTSGSSRGQRIYTSPVVFHLSMTLAMSAVLLVPRLSLGQAAATLGACAALGAGWSAHVSLTLILPNDVKMTDWTDPVCYGLIPAALYLLLFGAAWAVWSDAALAPYGLGAGLLALLLISIRNAWDLATFIAQRARRDPDGAEQKPPPLSREDPR